MLYGRSKMNSSSSLHSRFSFIWELIFATIRSSIAVHGNKDRLGDSVPVCESDVFCPV